MTAATDTFADAPQVSPEQAQALAAERFGLRGATEPLRGERDRNFRLTTPDGVYVFKVHPPSEDPAVVDFQVCALEHLAAVDPGLQVPRVVPALDGEPTAIVELEPGAPQLARVLTYVPGDLLGDVRPLNAAALRGVGAILGRLDRGLRGFYHPSARYPLLWDLQRAEQLVPLVPFVGPDDARHAVAEALARYAADVVPALRKLRAQVIHNDAHYGNVLIDPVDRDRVVGVLDFGDLVHAPLVQELAVATSYLLGPEDELLAPVAAVVAAYARVVPLEPDDVDLLLDLIAVRRAMSLTIWAWRSRDDTADFLAAEPALTRDLQRVLAFPRARASAILRHAARVS